jgi:hypothetical protein
LLSDKGKQVGDREKMGDKVEQTRHSRQSCEPCVERSLTRNDKTQQTTLSFFLALRGRPTTRMPSPPSCSCLLYPPSKRRIFSLRGPPSITAYDSYPTPDTPKTTGSTCLAMAALPLPPTEVDIYGPFLPLLPTSALPQPQSTIPSLDSSMHTPSKPPDRDRARYRLSHMVRLLSLIPNPSFSGMPST